MKIEMIEQTITIPRYTVEYDEGAEPPAYCVAAPTIYGAERWIDRRRGELTACGCVEVDAPDWETIHEALIHFRESMNELQYADSLTVRYLKAFHGVKNIQLITSTVDQYAWAIVLDTASWREHIGIDPAEPGQGGNPVAHQYLDGDVYGVTDELTGGSLWGIYAENEQAALRVAKDYFRTDQEGTE